MSSISSKSCLCWVIKQKQVHFFLISQGQCKGGFLVFVVIKGYFEVKFCFFLISSVIVLILFVPFLLVSEYFCDMNCYSNLLKRAGHPVHWRSFAVTVQETVWVFCFEVPKKHLQLKVAGFLYTPDFKTAFPRFVLRARNEV